MQFRAPVPEREKAFAPTVGAGTLLTRQHDGGNSGSGRFARACALLATPRETQAQRLTWLCTGFSEMPVHPLLQVRQHGGAFGGGLVEDFVIVALPIFGLHQSGRGMAGKIAAALGVYQLVGTGKHQ